MENFNEEEKKEVFRNSVNLMREGLITGVNFIQSEKSLPETSIILHYLQDSGKHLEFVIEKINSFGVKEKIVLPRTTFYFLDPKYVKKRNFLDEYENAEFLDDESLAHLDIKEVIKNPNNVILKAKELDLLIPIEKENISGLVLKIQEADKKGPDKWVHPVIIVKGYVKAPIVPGFVKKDYVSLSRKKAEFYAIVIDEKKKRILKKQIDKICEEIKLDAKTSLGKDSVIYLPSQINPELDQYIKEQE